MESPLKFTVAVTGIAPRKFNSESSAAANTSCTGVLSMFVPTMKPLASAVGLKLTTGLTSEPILPPFTDVPLSVVSTMFLAVMLGASMLIWVLVVVCNRPALMPESNSDVVQILMLPERFDISVGFIM